MRLNRNNTSQQGVAYIELAIILMTMVTIFFGMVEITAYVRMKNKINQAADQIGEALSTIPYWVPGVQVDPLLPAAELMMRPFGAQVSLAFCTGEQGIVPVYTKSMTVKAGDCSLIQQGQTPTNPDSPKEGSPTSPVTSGGSSGGLSNAKCEDAVLNGKSMVTENPTTQFVVVDVACNYKPYIESKIIFGDSGIFGKIAVTSHVVKPMRYHMQWDLPEEEEDK
ncbi:hypothetical protein GC177_03155 [bacterium]|nr:hypothetical protein [bacterium]